MAKWVVRIQRHEVYERDFAVEAENLDEAIAKTEREWERDLYLYECLENCMTDSDTRFYKRGLATEDEINNLISID